MPFKKACQIFEIEISMKNLPNISLQTAMTLTEWSERTIRRRLADGVLQYIKDTFASNKALISFDAIQSDVCIPLSDEDIELISAADSGDAKAQNDLALLFLVHGKQKSALYWLESAAKQSFSDAMHGLGGCYLRGEGVPKDDNIAVMWIAKAASLGHGIASEQIKALSSN